MFKLDLEKAEEKKKEKKRKGRGTRDQIANIHWIIEKAREFQKNVYFCFIEYAKCFDCVGHNKLWKILKEMGIQDHLTCLLRNLYVGQEATVRTGHGKTDWFQIGKGICQGCILSSCLFNFYTEYILKNSRLDEAQDRIKIAWSKGRITKEPLDESDRRDWKSWFKTQHSTKFLASSPITSWQIDGETMGIVADFILLGS